MPAPLAKKKSRKSAPDHLKNCRRFNSVARDCRKMMSRSASCSSVSCSSSSCSSSSSSSVTPRLRVVRKKTLPHINPASRLLLAGGVLAALLSSQPCFFAVGIDCEASRLNSIEMVNKQCNGEGIPFPTGFGDLLALPFGLDIEQAKEFGKGLFKRNFMEMVEKSGTSTLTIFMLIIFPAPAKGVRARSSTS